MHWIKQFVEGDYKFENTDNDEKENLSLLFHEIDKGQRL